MKKKLLLGLVLGILILSCIDMANALEFKEEWSKESIVSDIYVTPLGNYTAILNEQNYSVLSRNGNEVLSGKNTFNAVKIVVTAEVIGFFTEQGAWKLYTWEGNPIKSYKGWVKLSPSGKLILVSDSENFTDTKLFNIAGDLIGKLPPADTPAFFDANDVYFSFMWSIYRIQNSSIEEVVSFQDIIDSTYFVDDNYILVKNIGSEGYLVRIYDYNNLNLVYEKFYDEYIDLFSFKQGFIINNSEILKLYDFNGNLKRTLTMNQEIMLDEVKNITNFFVGDQEYMVVETANEKSTNLFIIDVYGDIKSEKQFPKYTRFLVKPEERLIYSFEDKSYSQVKVTCYSLQ